MNINDIHIFMDLVTSKERGGFNTPAEKDQALDRASMAIFNYYKPLYAKNIEAKEALASFRSKYTYTTDGTGLIAVPSIQNMTALLSMDVSVADAEATAAGYASPRIWDVTFPNEDELPYAKNSQINKPTATTPIADIEGINTYRLTPAQVHTGTIYFLKRPAVPVFAYTQVGRTITYNSAGSTQLEWTEPYLSKVIFKALSFLGVNLDSEKIVQYSEQMVSNNI